jgi:hypothetical protein
MKLIEDAFVFLSLAPINVEFRNSLLLYDDIVESEAANARARPQPVVEPRLDVGVACPTAARQGY